MLIKMSFSFAKLMEQNLPCFFWVFELLNARAKNFELLNACAKNEDKKCSI